MNLLSCSRRSVWRIVCSSAEFMVTMNATSLNVTSLCVLLCSLCFWCLSARHWYDGVGFTRSPEQRKFHTSFPCSKKNYNTVFCRTVPG
jgi:hypothetical protein